MVSLGTFSSSSLASWTIGLGGGLLGPSSNRNSSRVAGSFLVPTGGGGLNGGSGGLAGGGGGGLGFNFIFFSGSLVGAKSAKSGC